MKFRLRILYVCVWGGGREEFLRPRILAGSNFLHVLHIINSLEMRVGFNSSIIADLQLRWNTNNFSPIAPTFLTPPWSWRQQDAPKLYYPTTWLHGVTTQKTATWKLLNVSPAFLWYLLQCHVSVQNFFSGREICHFLCNVLTTRGKSRNRKRNGGLKTNLSPNLKEDPCAWFVRAQFSCLKDTLQL
jgi:hypothetical protein